MLAIRQSRLVMRLVLRRHIVRDLAVSNCDKFVDDKQIASIVCYFKSDLFLVAFVLKSFYNCFHIKLNFLRVVRI